MCEYVSTVCTDRLLTSSDPVEAFLLDAECVRRWCQKTLATSRGRLSSWLARGIAHVGSAPLQYELARLQALQLVARALVAAASESGSPAAGDLGDAERLAHAARVLAWLTAVQERGGGGRGFACATGRYSSEQEWRSVVAKRRDGAAPLTLCLAETRTAVARHGVEEEGAAYPPSTPERMVAALFLAGSTDPVALHAKLALLSYMLLDGAFVPEASVVAGLQ